MAAATGTTTSMTPEVKKVFDTLDTEFAARAVIRCGGKTEHFTVKKMDRKPLTVVDNALTFDETTLDIQLHTNKSSIAIRRRNGPIEMALHTESGRAYVSTEDGKTYKSHAEGSVKIKKAAKGDIEVQTGSSVCTIV